MKIQFRNYVAGWIAGWLVGKTFIHALYIADEKLTGKLNKKNTLEMETNAINVSDLSSLLE